VKKIVITAITIILIVITIIASYQMVTAQITDEEISIQNANLSINQAFNSTLAAEKAGGNVTQLLARLNTAGQLLADAQNTYQTGTLTGVTSKANSAKQIADQVNTEALTLKNASQTLTQNSFWFIVTFSIGGAIVFALIMLLAWQRFRRSYIKKMLSMKPEVVDNNAT
jgi:hypothetical protein